MHRADPHLARRRGPEHDPRRRRRRHDAGPQGPRVGGRRAGARPPPRRTPRSSGSSRSSSAETLQADPQKWTTVAEGIKGVTEETTTGVHRLYQLAETGDLLFPAINVNDSVTKSKFDNKYGCRHSLHRRPQPRHRRPHRRQGRRRLRLRRRRQGLRRSRCAARAPASSSPRSTRSARCRPRWRASRSPASRTSSRPADIFITTTGCYDVITAEHMQRMKNKAIVANIGHFDNEIDMAGLAKVPGIKKTEIKPQVHEWTFADGNSIIVLSEGRLMNLGNATGHPCFVMSNSFANQTIAQIELFTKTGEYENAGLHAAQAPRREGRAPAPRRPRRRAHRADQGPGRVPRRRRRRPVQAGALPLLRLCLRPPRTVCRPLTSVSGRHTPSSGHVLQGPDTWVCDDSAGKIFMDPAERADAGEGSRTHRR